MFGDQNIKSEIFSVSSKGETQEGKQGGFSYTVPFPHLFFY